MNSFELRHEYPKVEQLKDYLGWTGADEIDLVAVCMNLCDHIKDLERRLNKVNRPDTRKGKEEGTCIRCGSDYDCNC